MPFDGSKREERYATRKLQQARKLIETGWIPGKLEDGRGGYCAIGAVRHVTGCVFDVTQMILGLLAKHATYRGRDDYNWQRVEDDSSASAKIAGHNNMLGKEATLKMFDAAIEESFDAP